MKVEHKPDAVATPREELKRDLLEDVRPLQPPTPHMQLGQPADPHPTALLPWIDDLAHIGTAGRAHDESHRPNVVAPTAGHHAPSVPRVADASSPDVSKLRYDPALVSMAAASIPEAHATGSVRLPAELTHKLDESWQRTQKADHWERGGNIILDDQHFEYRHGGDTPNKSGWEPDFNDKGHGQRLVGTYHTHDYEGEPHPGEPQPYKNVTFSEGDVSNMSDLDRQISIVRSNDSTFMLARTKEFDAQVNSIENERDPEKLMERRRDFKQQMEGTYNAAYAKALKAGASFADACDAGVQAAAQHYHLLYYKGQGSVLHRAGQPPK